jgi:hypothetical protein
MVKVSLFFVVLATGLVGVTVETGCSSSSSSAKTDVGEIRCWGNDRDGQLGDGVDPRTRSEISNDPPVAVAQPR